jgi:cyclopropane fatty-acyl-phospholipid synthase-like methyltransferase
VKYAEAAKADYYQRLHDENAAFQRNNWLTDEVSTLKALGGDSILELGCGNGLFLDEASRIWSRVVGVDWARSSVLDEVLGRCRNVQFEQEDVRIWAPTEKFDIVASADFLEHIAPHDLSKLIERISTFGRFHFHKIACYDDGHSHLSIFPPIEWLAAFSAAVPHEKWRIAKEASRKGSLEKRVICVVNAD